MTQSEFDDAERARYDAQQAAQERDRAQAAAWRSLLAAYRRNADRMAPPYASTFERKHLIPGPASDAMADAEIAAAWQACLAVTPAEEVPDGQ